MVHYFEPNDEIKYFHGKKEERLIFGDSNDYSPEEKEKIEKLNKYLEASEIKLDPKIDDAYKLRFLAAHEMYVDRAAINLKKHQKYLDKKCPILLSDDMKQVLDSGILYVHGRDRCFRPILIYNASALNEFLKFSYSKDILKACMFVLFYVVENLLFAGKVENWLLVIDFNHLSIKRLPVKFLKNFINKIMTHFKKRSRAIYCVNVSFGTRSLWHIMKPFNVQSSKKKVHTSNKSYHKEMKELIHPSQLERKYGGEAKNLTDFWPPVAISDDYGFDKDLMNDMQFDEESIGEGLKPFSTAGHHINHTTTSSLSQFNRKSTTNLVKFPGVEGKDLQT